MVYITFNDFFKKKKNPEGKMRDASGRVVGPRQDVRDHVMTKLIGKPEPVQT